MMAYSDAPDRLILIGGLSALALFGAFSAWAGTMSLASAALAPGRVIAEGNRKAVQHRDGGPIAAVLVKEGQRVTKGQPLIELDLAETQAEANVLTAARWQLLAKVARLKAELPTFKDVNFPAELVDSARSDPGIRAIMDQELALLHTRRESHLGNIAIQQQLIEASRAQVNAFESRITSNKRQLKLTADELRIIGPLAEKTLVPQTRVLALQRSEATLQGEMETLQGGIATEIGKQANARLQIIQLERQRQETSTKELSEAEAKLADTEPRLAAARSKLGRSVLVSPEDGFVYGLAVFDSGAAVTPGQTVMEIVPADDRLVIEAQIDPSDINRLRPGQEARIRLLPLPQNSRILLNGRLEKVSADRFDDTKANRSYYRAIVSVDKNELKRFDIELLPGMPCEVMINTGERTVAGYFLDPILRVYDFAMREQ